MNGSNHNSQYNSVQQSVHGTNPVHSKIINQNNYQSNAINYSSNGNSGANLKVNPKHFQSNDFYSGTAGNAADRNNINDHSINQTEHNLIQQS